MEFLNCSRDAAWPALATSYTGTAGDCTAYPPGPSAVLVWCDTAAYVLVGEGVTATTANGTPIPANTPIPFIVPKGTGAPWRVSAIRVASSGTLYTKPMNN